jgi:hypothetical protein
MASARYIKSAAEISAVRAGLQLAATAAAIRAAYWAGMSQAKVRGK